MTRRVVSIGLDGAAWHALDPMIEAGELPNLARFAETGARADLRSVSPPVTCPAWRCSTAGKNPGKLGVYWWLTLNRSTGDLRTPDAGSFQTADLWDYLGDAGLESAVLNVPMTYPPSAIDGVMVSGFGAPFDLDLSAPITHPPDLEPRLREEYDWEIGVDDVTAPDGPERAYDLIRSRFELLFDLLETGRFAYHHLTVFYINVLQHKYGDGPETRTAWRLIDDYLGELEDRLEDMDDDVLTVLYSDHGHADIENTFVVNRYLADAGYLSFDDDGGNSLGQRVYSGLKRLGLSPRAAATTARNLLPQGVYQRLAPEYPIPTGEVADRVDWERSTAMAVSQGPLYLNRQRLGDDAEAVRATLAAELRGLTHDGRPVLDSVSERDAVYAGNQLGAAPDLVLEPAAGWEIYGGITPDTFETQVTSWTSGNHPRGMVVLHGDGVEAGELPEHSLLDVMPTVLRYLGCSVPSDVDGSAISAPFGDGTLHSGTRAPLGASTTGSAGDESAVRDRLQELGYLE